MKIQGLRIDWIPANRRTVATTPYWALYLVDRETLNTVEQMRYEAMTREEVIEWVELAARLYSKEDKSKYIILARGRMSPKRNHRYVVRRDRIEPKTLVIEDMLTHELYAYVRQGSTVESTFFYERVRLHHNYGIERQKDAPKCLTKRYMIKLINDAIYEWRGGMRPMFTELGRELGIDEPRIECIE